MRLFGRHQIRGILRADAGEQLAFAGLSRNDRLRLDRRVPDVEPQIPFPFAGVEAVTEKSVLRKDRPHIPVEGDLVRNRRLGCAECRRKPEESEEPRQRGQTEGKETRLFHEGIQVRGAAVPSAARQTAKEPPCTVRAS